MVATVAACVRAQVVQTPPPRPEAAEPDKLTVESSRRQAPQVLTIIHRLDGLKALALLRGNGETVATVDDELLTASDAVTSITAGFALGDGENVVARLPQAEALAVFQPFNMSWSFVTPPPGTRPGATTVAQTAPPAPRTAELVVVQSNGRQLPANYVGLDGGSGLSLLRIQGLKVSPAARDAAEEQLAIGQTVRLFAPVLAGVATAETISLRVGEIEGRITGIARTSTGKVVYLTVSAQNLSPAIVGGVALNEAGETVGIVEASEGGKARLIPAAAVRRAAQRVLARRASVPRPWLGVRGEAVAAFPLEKFHSIGWAEVDAAMLKAAHKGIVLTTVAPGTPAALANLRPGDVILRVNDFEVKSAEDFSFFLNEAGSGANVNFTFLRGPDPVPAPPLTPPAAPPAPALAPQPAGPAPRTFEWKPLEVSIKLGEAMNPARAMKLAEAYAAVGTNGPAPFTLGIEVVALSAKAASHLGARGGMLVVFIEPESNAARAGLHVFDVIESVNGKPLNQTTRPISTLAGDARQITLGIVRDRQKVEVTVQRKD
jgi:S1-C subfamily serine protease